MYDFWVQFTKYMFAFVAMLWMLLGIGMLFAGSQYPVAAIGMNAVSVIGVCAFNALQVVRSRTK